MAPLESFFGGFIKEKRSINSDECFEAVRWSLHKPLTRHPKKKNSSKEAPTGVFAFPVSMCNWESQQAPLTARAEVIQKRLANSERVSTYTKHRNKASHADHSNQLAVPHAAVPQCFIGSGNMSHLHRANSPLLFIFFYSSFLFFFVST